MVDVSVQEIVEAMQAHGGELHGDGSIRVARIAALEHATADSISFLSNPRFADLLDSTPVACLIVAPAMLDAASKPGRACIVTDNPYAWYAHFTQWWKRRTRPAPEHHIHPSAVVHPEAEVHETAIIGPLCVVERGARVGAHIAGAQIEGNVLFFAPRADEVFVTRSLFAAKLVVEVRTGDVIPLPAQKMQ